MCFDQAVCDDTGQTMMDTVILTLFYVTLYTTGLQSNALPIGPLTQQCLRQSDSSDHE